MEPPEKPEVPPPETGAAPKAEGVSCKHCGKTFPSLGELGKHMWALGPEGHREAMLKLQKEGLAEKAKKRAEKKVEKEEGGPTPQPEMEGIVKRGMDAKRILEQILDAHPDISDAAKTEVLSMADLQPLNPQLVAWCLSQLKGVSKETANYVSNKFALALQKAQAEALGGQAQPPPAMQPIQPLTQVPPTTYILTPRGYVPVSTQPPQQALVQPQIQPPQVQPTQVQPLPVVTPQVPRPEKTYKLVVDGQEIETDEKGFMAWKRYLDEQKKPSEKPPSALTKGDIEEMMDKTKGELAQALVEKLERDKTEREKETLASMFAKSIERQDKSMERQDKLFEKIEKGELIKIPPPQVSPTPPMTKEDVAEMVKGVAKESRDEALRIIEAKSKENREDKRHQELIKAQQETQAVMRSGLAAQQVSGYKEDAYRFLGQGISAAAAAVERKEPIKIILQGVPQVLSAITPAPPGPKEITPGAEGAEMADVVSKLKPEYVVEK